jgi:predicted HTH transcriptional regulator
LVTIGAFFAPKSEAAPVRILREIIANLFIWRRYSVCF